MGPTKPDVAIKEPYGSSLAAQALPGEDRSAVLHDLPGLLPGEDMCFEKKLGLGLGTYKLALPYRGVCPAGI